jgi:hypothetical protein
MTLAPVFRSGELFELLEQKGLSGHFDEAVERMFQGVLRIHNDLPNVIDADFVETLNAPVTLADDPEEAAQFLRKYFFLILFSAVFDHIGIEKKRLELYAELSYCIMGTIGAADNLFDSEAKSFLPLKPVAGSVYASILQLMCFERLSMRAGTRAEQLGALEPGVWDEALKRLLSAMATIGKLEGTEEAGYDEILTPDDMVHGVHAIRGGMLFALATIAPAIIEGDEVVVKLGQVQDAFQKLGTAFQLVDDITDFEFDLKRKSHNIMVAEVYHNGSEAERAALQRLIDSPNADGTEVEAIFAPSARRALETAKRLTVESLEELEALGFWFPTELADIVIKGIVADHGAERMENLANA